MTRSTILFPIALLAACSGAPGPVEREVKGAATSTNGAAAPVAPPAPDAAPPASVPADEPRLAVEGEGLRLFNPASGTARPLAFGNAQAMVLAALAFRGPPGTGRQEECGAGPLDYAAWPDGLKLYFQQGKFTGWALDGRAAGALGTAAGIGPGNRRAELEAAYKIEIIPSTLGVEFNTGGFAGLLDGPAKASRITDMWAGTSCNFR